MGRRESRRTQKTSAGAELVGSRCALWDAASRPRPRQAGPAILTGCEPTRTTCLPYEIAQSTAVAQVVLPSRARKHADECALLNDMYCAALVLPELPPAANHPTKAGLVHPLRNTLTPDDSGSLNPPCLSRDHPPAAGRPSRSLAAMAVSLHL